MKAIKYISDPEAFKLLADDTRRKILTLLRVKEMTVAKIAEMLEVTPQTVYHHIRKLEDGGLVESTREERISTNLLEKYYRATAEVFQFSVGSRSSPETTRQLVASAIHSLNKIGFDVEYDDDAISKLAELQAKVDQDPHLAKYIDVISKLDDIDQTAKLTLKRYAKVLSLSDKEFTEFTDVYKEFWNLLRSLLKKKSVEKRHAPIP